MTDENKTDPGKNGKEGQGLPTPDLSGGDGAASSSNTEFDFEKLAKDPKFEQFIDGLVDKKVQSTKDRRIAKLENRVNDTEDQIAAYQKYIDAGQTPAEAKRNLQIDQLLQSQGTAPEQATQVPSNSGQGSSNNGWAAVQKHMLSIAGVDENDPGLISFISGQQFKGDADYLDKLGTWIRDRNKNQSSGDGVVIQPGGSMSGGANESDAEKMSKELGDLMKNPTPNFRKIQELSAKHKALISEKQ